MKYRFFIFINILLFVSCSKAKKENEGKTDIITNDYFSIATNLKTLKKVNKTILSDSLIKIEGSFSQYLVEGYINNIGQRINWWKIVDTKNNNAYNVRLEYRIIDDKEKVNQFIFYNNQRDYKINSKYFTRSQLNNVKNTIRYSFYTPSEYPKKNLLKKFEYFLFIDNKEVNHLDLDCLKQDTHFFVDINVPKYHQKIILKGLFTEVFENNNKPGQNEIYVLDTLKQ
ncbi:hypothetical protein [Chryseobacterium sediminis]|uniref:Uncharacterized protein n=1 Tax=Chryseobacterium sediminis TaxID=1679494 RepID=A0A5B2U252_9FLAO|nr:hypothetical protein [Chryseobacterium sediminis]KAA2220664.1 hypothetical protein FW780_17475 [Chryseobacterium sediminis]